MMFPDFDSICFDNSVKVYGLKGRDNLVRLDSLINTNVAPHIFTYSSCPDSIILFFRELTNDFPSTFVQGSDDSVIRLCFEFQDCLDLFIEKFKQSGDEEFDQLAQKVIELAILDKSITHLIMIV